MIDGININARLYEYILKYELDIFEMNEHSIHIDKEIKTCKISSTDGSTTLTIFSEINSMRYTPYSINSLMGTIISTFGYQSEMHRVMALFVQYVIVNHFKE